MARMQGRLDSTEQRQQQMMAMLAKAVHNPIFLQQLLNVNRPPIHRLDSGEGINGEHGGCLPVKRRGGPAGWLPVLQTHCSFGNALHSYSGEVLEGVAIQKTSRCSLPRTYCGVMADCHWPQQWQPASHALVDGACLPSLGESCCAGNS